VFTRATTPDHAPASGLAPRNDRRARDWPKDTLRNEHRSPLLLLRGRAALSGTSNVRQDVVGWSRVLRGPRCRARPRSRRGWLQLLDLGSTRHTGLPLPTRCGRRSRVPPTGRPGCQAPDLEPSGWSVVFDCETTKDMFHSCASGLPGAHDDLLAEAGFFYEPEISGPMTGDAAPVRGTPT